MAVFNCISIISLLTIFATLASCKISSKYTTPTVCTKTKVFTGDTGVFTSPGGKSGYGNNSRCVWEIKSQSLFSAKIVLTFSDFDVEPSKDCVSYDSVVVQEFCDGNWSKNLSPDDPNVEGYCGKRSDFTLTSKCGHVRVNFTSDDSVTGGGFKVSFKVHREIKPPMIYCLGAHCNKTQIEIAETPVIEIQCKVDGYPPPSVYWTKINGSMPKDSKESYNNTLLISNVKEVDSGRYQCFANNSNGTDSDELELIVKEKCKCPRYIKTNWYPLPPYMRQHQDPKFQTSIFILLLNQAFQKCCGNCSNGHGPSEILFNDKGSMKNSLVDVKNNLRAPETISFPIPGKKEDDTYQNTYKFQSIVSSPGIAFITVNSLPGTSAQAVFNSVLGGWPILILTLVMALLSGMIMWALDTWYNPDEFPRSFIKGSGEGFWWAFVTMTTVGYGDRSPRGYFARIFAIIWVLVGIVITSIFTGVVTTSLTAITLSTEVPLYGTKVVAITNSTEYKFGLNKNAIMQESSNLQQIASTLKARDAKGALVDTYVAGEEEKFNDTILRVSKIYDYDSHYGIVFGDEREQPMTKKSFQTCMTNYLAEKKAEFYKTVEKNTKPLTKPKESQAVERSSGLFDAESDLFKKSVYICLGLFLFLAACGIIWDYGYMRYWRMGHSDFGELEMTGTATYEMAKRNMDMMDAMMDQVQEFYDNWNRRLDEMTARHEQEQKLVSKNQSK